MANLSLKQKLFVILATISIIPTMVVGYSSQYFMFRSSTEHSASISSQYVEFVSQDIDNYLQELSRSFDELFTNADFQKFLDTPADDLVAQANHIIQFQPILKKTLPFHHEILGVLYLDQKGKHYFYSYQKQLNPNYSFAADPLYKSALLTRKPELTAPHAMGYTLASQENVFSFVRPVVNLNNGQITAWFIIEIREDAIKNMLSANGTTYRQEGQLLLYHDTKGTSVSHTSVQPELLQKLRYALDRQSPRNEEVIFTSQDVEYEATFTDIPYGGWKLVWLAPLNSINKGVEQSYHLTLLIALASLAAALVIAFPVMKFVLMPLYKLKEGMRRLSCGDYSPIDIKHSNDEIGFLVTRYNQTLVELQRLEQEVYQSKLKEKERELLQLQAQINPHFLFNTLETVESYAARNNGEAVGEMVQSVSKMMRYNVRNDGGWSPLKDELSYIKNFLKIHYYRNGSDVYAEFLVDPACLDIPVMKLSIQPFVENAIKYGWSPSMSVDEFLVTIQAELKGDLLYIAVRDTGGGIPADILAKLTPLIQSKGEVIDPYFQKHTGIYNVYRRFLLAYNNEIDFNITAVPSVGTQVEMYVPYRRQVAAAPQQPLAAAAIK
ncbi:HAMP domain-containing protein [Paenibacillus xerothermodurans]|uniref:HAMP domain-containing protein n=2 Tax=Paenibacillus xerothermodurans TaxID=1977292 RepID=A0A2W1NRM3_PAEXE|nr:HAMP domain-containing protein [Paenibacillus xerothermodurans]